jgi:hypothetical protein
MMSQMARYLFLVVDVFELHVFGCEHEVLGNEAVQLGKGDPLGNAEPPDVLIELYLERNVVRHGCWLVVAMRCLMGLLLVVDVLQKMRCAVVVLEIYVSKLLRALSGLEFPEALRHVKRSCPAARISTELHLSIINLVGRWL